MNVERHKRAWQINILQRCWIVFACVSTAFHPCEAQHTIPTATNSCQPVIQVTHATISCFDLKNSNKVKIPTVDTPCDGAITSLTYEDVYYELASRRTAGTAGYFDWSHWEKKSGDGGVDVTGAPNGILVEGANIAKVTVEPQQETVLRIVIPAEGYAAFDWKSIGGSNLLFETLVNDKVTVVRNAKMYRSPLLRVGDILTLRFESTETTELQFSNFKFFTNAIGVTERRWTATSPKGAQFEFNQLITVERPPVSSIIFPDDWNAQQEQMLNTTGFPVLDEDGDLNTLGDQRILEKNDCGYKISWRDQVNGSAATRHWVIEDVYNGNIVEHTQQIEPTSITVPEANAKQPTRSDNSDKNKMGFSTTHFENDWMDSF